MRDDTVQEILKILVDGLTKPAIRETTAIPWACPVPFFGNLDASRVATVGINPSDREFVDDKNKRELKEPNRRFHTLASLGLRTWEDVTTHHVAQIYEACQRYFLPESNSYDNWFRVLDDVLKGAGASFYPGGGPSSADIDTACHLDLIPYATTKKWSKLTRQQQRTLFEFVPDLLGRLVRDSPVRVLILNGNAVVKKFEKGTGLQFKCQEMPNWSLYYRTGPRPGYAYRDVVDTLFGVELGKAVTVLGYNHNLQGTPGVGSDMTDSIRNWISLECN